MLEAHQLTKQMCDQSPVNDGWGSFVVQVGQGARGLGGNRETLAPRGQGWARLRGTCNKAEKLEARQKKPRQKNLFDCVATVCFEAEAGCNAGPLIGLFATTNKEDE